MSDKQYIMILLLLLLLLICLFVYRPSFTQPPARKMQKLEGGDKLKKSKLSKFAAGDSKQGVDGDPSSKLKGETPDHFWSSVDPYCADITEADVHLLQDGINDVSVLKCVTA